MNIIKGYKGFQKDMTCNGFKYKEGETYEHAGEVKVCNQGFHFCENPLDVFGYYPPGESRFHEVVGEGSSDKCTQDSKVAVKKITIGAEIGLKSIIDLGIKFIFGKVEWKKENSVNKDSSGAQATGYRSGAQATGYSSGAQATGYRSGAQATGYRSGAQATGYSSGAQATGYRSGAQATGYSSGAQATGYRSGAQATGDRSGAQATGYSSGAQATGDRSGAQATGDRSGAQATGDRSGAQATGYRSGAQATGYRSMAVTNGWYSKAEVKCDKGKTAFACAFGGESKARGSIGAWLTIAEWKITGGTEKLLSVKSVRVDGKKIKADVWYELKGGKFKAVK